MSQLIRTASHLDAAGTAGAATLYPARLKILIGSASCGIAAGARAVEEAAAQAVADLQLDAAVSRTGCIGFCQQEPLLDLMLPGGPRISYRNMTAEKTRALLEAYAAGQAPAPAPALCRFEREEHVETGHIHTYPASDNGLSEIPEFSTVGFYQRQQRVILRNCGTIDPLRLDEAIARGAYRGAWRALTAMAPDEVIQEVLDAGLRGRGGGGFPTGVKWRFASGSDSETKYVICNADEGDPGAFMDRGVLEGDPHAMLEGLLIAAYAIGANEAYIYVRSEYPLAVSTVEHAIAQAEERGLLGEDIFGGGFSLKVKVRKGAGAFVCGEETSLIASIEGHSGEPRNRPPYPAVQGLWGKPTVVNNVKTLSSIGPILSRGAAWYAAKGSESNRGTTVFSLVGAVKNTGLVEVPLGISLKEMVYEIGGGTDSGRPLKAIQTGGPSGGCIPAAMLDLPVDYQQLAEAGSMMGSGGMIVLDTGTCMVDLARFFLGFTAEESCGKCVPCREGTKQMLRILTRICEGAGTLDDLALLERLGRSIQAASLCGLGSTAPNPVLSALRHFREEFEAHVIERRCPAGVCAPLVHAPCQNECPAGVDVPLYVSLTGAGRERDALLSHLQRNPFPQVCARVCPHPCEAKCRREQLDSPVAIRAIKRYMADAAGTIDPREMLRPNAHNAAKRVAVAGAGPAGLSCGYFLRRLGYAVTIFEKESRAGGMMMYTIPEYRLPRDVLQREIDWVLGAGIELKTNTEIGKDLTLADLHEQGYQAIFLGLGAWRGMALGIEGEELAGVAQGLDFLLARNRGEEFPVGKNVAVIGGGDVAIDSARVALRMGAAVTVVYRRQRNEMPAIESEIEEAELEGVQFEFLARPERIAGSGGRASRLVCRRMRLGAFGLDGRRRPEDTDEVFELEADTVIAAIGQRPETKVIAEQAGLTVGSSGRISVQERTHETGVSFIYAGGDVVTGPSIVLAAIGAGERAAVAINEKLSAELPVDQRATPFWRETAPSDAPFDPEAAPVESPRLTVPVLRAEDRRTFAEVEQTAARAAALAECGRCLRCDYKEPAPANPNSVQQEVAKG